MATFFLLHPLLDAATEEYIPAAVSMFLLYVATEEYIPAAVSMFLLDAATEEYQQL